MVEEHISRVVVGGVIHRQCNICGYQTARTDKVTIPEHLFSHFPDICGFSCPVCRKPEKRRKELVRHMEASHSAEILQV